MDKIQNQFPRADRNSTPVDRLKEILDAAGISYVIHAHDQAVESAQDGFEWGFGKLANMTPALVLRVDEGYLVAIIRGDTRLSYKKIKQKFRAAGELAGPGLHLQHQLLQLPCQPTDDAL